MICPHCQESARFKGYRKKGVISVLGELVVERGYYYCRHCRRGHCPSDDAFGLDAGDLTSGAAELISLAGTLDSGLDGSGGSSNSRAPRRVPPAPRSPLS